MSSVKLHGNWASPYTMRVHLGLKVKGIPYEYIEEDLSNKSELLLRYNPIHKKVPVLVHDGRPIVESLAILDYLDETWSNPPHLLPKDPYVRAKHRFWVAYFQTVIELMGKTLRTDGETQQKATKELLEKLDIAEEGLKEIFPNGAPPFQDGNIGYLDIVAFPYLGIRQAATEAFGSKLLNPERHPLLASCIEAISQVPIVKETMPPVPKLLDRLRLIRQKALQAQPSA